MLVRIVEPLVALVGQALRHLLGEVGPGARRRGLAGLGAGYRLHVRGNTLVQPQVGVVEVGEAQVRHLVHQRAVVLQRLGLDLAPDPEADARVGRGPGDAVADPGAAVGLERDAHLRHGEAPVERRRGARRAQHPVEQVLLRQLEVAGCEGHENARLLELELAHDCAAAFRAERLRPGLRARRRSRRHRRQDRQHYSQDAQSCVHTAVARVARALSALLQCTDRMWSQSGSSPGRQAYATPVNASPALPAPLPLAGRGWGWG